MKNTLPLILALALLGGCDDDDDDFVVVPPVVLHEVEPNDDVDDANFIGIVEPGDHFLINGEIAAFGTDLFDGFAAVAAVPIEVEFVLAVEPGQDLDLWIYDPLIDEFVLLFETQGGEAGTFSVFDAGTEFHLVVTPFELAFGDYELEVFVQPLPGFPPSAAAAPDGGERRIVGEGATDGRPLDEAKQRAYARRVASHVREPAPQPAATGTLIEVDPSNGRIVTRPVVRLDDGRIVPGPRTERTDPDGATSAESSE